MDDLHISSTPAAFIRGQVLDERGLPPHRCHFTLLRQGHRGGRSGYIVDTGSHAVEHDGHFSSPPLHPGRYCIRFTGILEDATDLASEASGLARQHRIFDFLYPNAQGIADASIIDLQSGESINHLEVHIPRPSWFTVRGKLTGLLPTDMTYVYVHFIRELGLLDEPGSGGAKIDSTGAFEEIVQPGRYKLRVWEMAPPNEAGYTQMIRELGQAGLSVGDSDVNGLEIPI